MALSCFDFFSVSVSGRWFHPLFVCVEQEEIEERRCFVDMKYRSLNSLNRCNMCMCVNVDVCVVDYCQTCFV